MPVPPDEYVNPQDSPAIRVSTAARSVTELVNGVDAASVSSRPFPLYRRFWRNSQKMPYGSIYFTLNDDVLIMLRGLFLMVRTRSLAL